MPKLYPGQPTKTAPVACPHCGYVMNGYTCISTQANNNRAPHDGDLFLCTECCEFYAYDEKTGGKLLTKKQKENLKVPDEIKQFRAIIQLRALLKPKEQNTNSSISLN